MDPDLKTVFKEFVNSPCGNNYFIEPFFEKASISEMSKGVTFKKGKNLYLKKKDVWVSPSNERNTDNYYFSIVKVNNTYVLAHRKPNTKGNDFHTQLFAGSISKDGLTFGPDKVIMPASIENHDPFLYAGQQDGKNVVAVFRGQSVHKWFVEGSRKHYCTDELISNGLAKMKDNEEYIPGTGVNYTEFKNGEMDVKNTVTFVTHEEVLPVSPNQNQFDTLNTVNYHNSKYYCHVRINYADMKNKLNRQIGLVRLDKSKKLIKDAKRQQCTLWKLDGTQLHETDIYIPVIFEYPHTSFNLSIPSGYIPSPVARYACGLYYTQKDNQLEFHELRTKNEFDQLLGEKNDTVVFVNGMVESVNQLEYYLYTYTFSRRPNINGKPPPGVQSTGPIKVSCYAIEKDRFNCVCSTSDDEEYVQVTPPNGYTKLSINFETFDKGYIICELIDKNKNSVERTNKYVGNQLNTCVDFKTSVDDFSNYFIKFYLYKTNLYSYKLI